MATVEITAPVNENEATLKGWIENVSQYIDAGSDVEFIDSNGNDTSISMISLDTAGQVCFWGIGMTIDQAKSVALVDDGWHVIPGIHGIRAADTSTGVAIKVKI